jgi:P27 family predicted phage terminase small subunit
MRGRKPKPTQRQIAEGDPRKKGTHKLQEKLLSEPNAPRGLPPCPDHLAGLAKTAWDFWVKELVDMNLDCRPDAMMLEGACVNYQMAVEADDIIRRCGVIVTDKFYDKDGNLLSEKQKAHPAVAVSNAAWRQVKSFGSEFGLSPVSRTRLTIDAKKQEEEELDDVLSAPRENTKRVQ